MNIDIVKKYYNVTDNADEADFALVFIQNPTATIGYDKEDLKKGGNGYIPISLQYGDYTATEAREKALLAATRWRILRTVAIKTNRPKRPTLPTRNW